LTLKINDNFSLNTKLLFTENRHKMKTMALEGLLWNL
jgi:hypothetical protein